ncbi:MAG: hypothetical protein SHS37scaffold145_87 [Phage 71_18]|nr:MAG: hypothetical protein SHS37scaffold145_87 [Phage 71_18]
MVTTPTPVAPPLPPAPRFGLLVAASVIPDAGERWDRGYTFPPYLVTGAGVIDPCDMTTAFDVPDRPDIVEAQPFAVVAGDVCSAFGWTEQNYVERAEDALAWQESEQTAAEFWTGDLATAAGWTTNQRLEAGAAVHQAGLGLDPVQAMHCLEQSLADQQGNLRGMIHATIGTLSHWLDHHLLERQGNLWLSPHGHIVVTDAGYPGSGPTGTPAANGAVWAYATGLVTVRRGPLILNPETLPEALNRQTNTVTFRAERLMSPSWDGEALVGVSLNINVCS